jgi:sugar fermentation stimulation protein A
MVLRSDRQTGGKGIYTLLLKVNSDEWIIVGRLGRFRFSGFYAYTGSAIGKGSTSLNNRVSRHLRHKKKARWHIDYVLGCPSTEVEHVITSRTEIKSKECEVSRNILASTGCIAPVPKFGSSDCSCRSHLVHLEGSLPEALQTILGAYEKSGLDAETV